jgi:hypothetical protein
MMAPGPSERGGGLAQNVTYRVRTIGRLHGHVVEFGVHVRQVGVDGSPADIASLWVGNVMPAVLAATSVEVNWDVVRVSDTRPPPIGTEGVDLPLTQPHPGLVAGECLPGQNSMLISFRTGLKGRRVRGRCYVPGVSETMTVGGKLTGTQLTALQALGQEIYTTFGAGQGNPNYALVVHSPPTPPVKVKPPPPVHTDTLDTPITVADASELIRTQRRRQIGVGA